MRPVGPMKSVITTTLLCGLSMVPLSVNAIQFELSPEVQLNLTGYVRGWLAMNMQDHPEIGANGKPVDGKGELSMARFTTLLRLQTQLGKTNWVAIGRFSREAKTGYLDDLEDSASAKGLPVDLLDQYNEDELREFYMEMNATERLYLRLGKQQVVWGETDFFQAMDVIHGYDNSIVQFQAENEEWRKPLWLVNLEYAVFEWDGSFQLVVRPGLDSGSDMGNTLDFFGGRWAGQPNKGSNTLRVFPYNFHHDKGDADDPSYGGRWTGIAGNLSYSINYYHTMQQEPILNFVGNPYGNAPKNGLGEFIFPDVDIIGATASGPIWGGVWRSEVAFTPNKPYNYGFIGTPSAGAGGVIEKDTVRLMLGYDRSLRSMSTGANTPPSLSLQLFDTWLTNFDSSDQITDITAKKKEHSIVGTTIFNMNFNHDTITPSVAIIHDVTYGGGLVIPAIEYKPGSNWRFKAEAYLFYKSKDTCSTSPSGSGYGCTHTFGTLDNNNQLVARVTYQF